MPKPIGKHRPERRIDRPSQQPFSVAAGDGGSVPQIAPPVPPTIAVPTGLTLTTTLYSAITPSARINAAWRGLESYDLERYAVQISTDSGFADTATETYRTGVNQTSATVDNRRVGTLYYVRVAAVVGDTQGDWSAVASITTGTDTIAPSAPTGVSAAFFNAGDLLVAWANPPESNFRDVEVTVWNSAAKTTQYWIAYSATGRFVFTAGMNSQATAGVYDPALYVELRARNWNEAYSAAVNASATLARPATPTGLTTSWAGDTGTAGPDCTIRWTALAGYRYWLTIDSVARALGQTDQFTETLDANRTDHSGTPDQVLSLSLVAVDALGQTSTTPATATATNAAPPAPTVTLAAGFSFLVATITSAPAADFLAFEYVWKRDGATVRTLESPSREQQYELTTAEDGGSHSWTVAVRQRDVFGQYSSSATTSNTVVLEALTLGTLRAGAFYSDDIASTFIPPSGGALGALKDDNRASGGVTYAA